MTALSCMFKKKGHGAAHDYVQIEKGDGTVSVLFSNEDDKPMEIGEKMCEINENAYMNGYNWDALLRYYLAENAPELLEGLDSDPEAGSYAAYYELTDENERKAERLAGIIVSLIENEDALYRLVREKGDEIEWE